jgi:hypothetical protein
MGFMRWAVGLWLHMTTPVAYMMDSLTPGPGSPYEAGILFWAMDNLHKEDK